MVVYTAACQLRIWPSFIAVVQDKMFLLMSTFSEALAKLRADPSQMTWFGEDQWCWEVQKCSTGSKCGQILQQKYFVT